MCQALICDVHLPKADIYLEKNDQACADNRVIFFHVKKVPVKADVGVFFDFFNGKKCFRSYIFHFSHATNPFSRAISWQFSRVYNFHFQQLKFDCYSFARSKFLNFPLIENVYGKILFLWPLFSFIHRIFFLHGHCIKIFSWVAKNFSRGKIVPYDAVWLSFWSSTRQIRITNQLLSNHNHQTFHCGLF